MIFRPGPFKIIFTAICVAILAQLGLWQLDRLEWKTALLAELAEERKKDASQANLRDALKTPQTILDRDIVYERGYLKGRLQTDRAILTNKPR